MNKIALVTGGSRGLGKSMVMALAKKGISVIFTYQKQQLDAEQLIQKVSTSGGKAAALQLDMNKLQTFPAFSLQLKEILSQWNANQIDILVNNAGNGIHASFMETTEAQFDSLMNTHLKGTFFLTQTLIPLLKKGGNIINISSGLARFSNPGYAAYAVMKGGIEVLTRYLAKELGPQEIRVNTLAPGAIETDFAGGVVRDNAELNQQIAQVTALGRVGLPEDIGPAVASLVSDDNRWITGQRIEISGGMML